MKVLIAAQDRMISQQVIPFIQQHSWKDEAHVQVVHVAGPVPFGYGADLKAFDRMLVRCREMVNSIVKEIRVSIPIAKVEGIVLQGNPAEEIVRIAREVSVQLIILGSHKRGLVGRLVHGSVSQSVIAAAPCSVLVLPNAHVSRQNNTQIDSSTVSIQA